MRPQQCVSLLTILALAALLVGGGNSGRKHRRQGMIGRSLDLSRRHLLLPRGSGGGGSHSEWQGCLSYSDEDLAYAWSFTGDAPDCSWVHHTDSSGGSGGSSGSNSGSYGGNSGGKGGGSSGSGSSGSGSGSSSGSSGGGGGNSGGNGSSGGDDNSAGGSSGNGDDGYDGGGNGEGGNGGGGDDSSGENGGNGDSGGDDQNEGDDVVVSNEDISNGDSTYDPIEDFNIVNCDTYENLWIWDLSLSCGTEETSLNDFSSYSDCNCSFAEVMMDEGLLTCEDAQLCPRDCSICATCMTLLGCDGVMPNGATGASDFISTPLLMYILAGVVAFLVISLGVYYARRKRANNQDLHTKLMEAHGVPDGTQDGLLSDSDETSDFKVPVTHDHYNLQSIQPVGTMSTTSGTVSTGRLLEDRIQPGTEQSVLAPPSDGERSVVGDNDLPTSFNETGVQLDLETGMVSPMPTMEGSSDEDEDDEIEESRHDQVQESLQGGMEYEDSESLPTID